MQEALHSEVAAAASGQLSFHLLHLQFQDSQNISFWGLVLSDFLSYRKNQIIKEFHRFHRICRLAPIAVDLETHTQ
jgi:hypothetical protein